MSKCFRICLAVAAAVLLVADATYGQETNRTPEEQAAKDKRLYELLLHPTFVSMRLLSIPRNKNDVPSDAPPPFKVTDRIKLQLFFTQSSSETFIIWSSVSPYYQCRLDLTTAGEIVSYKPFVQKQTEGDDIYSGSGAQFRFEPGRERGPEEIDLDDWYDPLGPGRYQLIVRKQFAVGGDWIASNPVYFEVVQLPPPSPIPAGVSIELAPDLSQTKKNGIYEPTDDVIVAILVVNNSNQSLKLNVIDHEYGNRLQLFKDGKPVPYRQEVAEHIKAKEENPRLVEIVNDIFLNPKTGRWPQGISLKKWYGPLAPGSYRLTDRHRFEIDGPWTDESEPLLFEVLPPKQK
jgi:hypothetical protein